MQRTELDGSALPITLLVVSECQVETQGSICGGLFQSDPILPDGLVETSGMRQRRAQIRAGFDHVGTEFDHFAVLSNRRGIVASFLRGNGVAKEIFRIRRRFLGERQVGKGQKDGGKSHCF